MSNRMASQMIRLLIVTFLESGDAEFIDQEVERTTSDKDPDKIIPLKNLVNKVQPK